MAVTRRSAETENFIRTVIADSVRRDVEDVHVGQRAARTFLDVEEIKAILAGPIDGYPAGWTRGDLILAAHSLQPTKDAPIALKGAIDRVNARSSVAVRSGDGDAKPRASFAVIPVVRALAVTADDDGRGDDE